MSNVVKTGLTKFLRGFLIFFFLVLALQLNAQQDTSNANSILKSTTTPQTPVLTLSEIIPQASALKNKLAILESSVVGLVDVNSINKEYGSITDELKKLTESFNDIKKEEHASTNELDYLKSELGLLGQSFYNINDEITSAIQKVEKARTDWIADQKKWKDYDKEFSQEEIPSEAQQGLDEANKTINDGLKIIVNELNVLMQLQQTGYNNQSVINNLNNQILILRQKKIENSFQDGSIPMYSSKFYKQFNHLLWEQIKRGASSVILPSEVFFKKYGWIIALQIIISLLVIFLIRINKKLLSESKEYGFFKNRSISAGLFFGVVLVLMFHIDTQSPPFLRYVSFLIGGASFCRLISSRIMEVWKKEFLYALVTVIVTSGLFDVFNLPVPLFRLFILIVSILGIYKLYHWNRENRKTINSTKYLWFFNLLILYLIIVIISEIIGKELLALYMYGSMLKTVLLFVFMYVFVNMIRAGIIAALRAITKGNSNITEDLIHKTVVRITTIVAILVVALGLIPRLLVYWSVFKDVADSYNQFMAYGVTIGKLNITVKIIITSFSILYGSYILSTINEMILMNDRFDRKLDRGTRISFAHLMRYFLVFFGFIFAVAELGFDLTNFTIVLSALSVGIGFGLQGLVNNFVSGLILLFERPIREGDTIEMEGLFSEVQKIGLRSTTVRKFDDSDVIIPNADLVYNNVINWTLSNKRKRIQIAVGVAYASDINLVMKILNEIGLENNDLVKSRKPVVLFMNFGDSTLNFELRVWARDVNSSMQVESDLRIEINKRFREHNIEISFPQRDLHIRSIDEGVSFVGQPKKNKAVKKETSPKKEVPPKKESE
jgi:small-conductance mechanosensitive channel